MRTVVGQAPPSTTAADDDGGANPRRWLIFAIVSVGMLMASIDQTIVATALPAIGHELHAPINWAGWTITVYALGRVLVLPLAGRVSDQYGRRTVFLVAIAMFTLASLFCGLADNIYELLVLRAVQAIGGAGFIPSATGMVADNFGAQRDRAVGMFTSINPIGGIIGPAIGGVFVTYWSWRGIFLVNVPIGAVLIVVALKYIPRNAPVGTRARLDILGMASLGAAILGGMVGISYLGGRGASLSGVGLLLPAAVAVVALTVFVWHTSRTSNPFIPVKLLRGHGFGVMNTINFLYGSAALGFGALVPLYATQRYGIRTLESGTLLSARSVGIIAFAGISAMALRRTGYRGPMVGGFLLTAAGLVAMSLSPIHLSPYAWLALAACLTGVGMGVSLPAANNASLQLAPEHVAAVAGLRGMFRQAGQITAVSVSTAILARSGDPGLTQAHIFAMFALVLVCITPFIALVPEHRGNW
ncbi:MAG TPA: MFS transporter [Micromonosporaceae bacterium]|nr:MFS transporter [Micromonosporaceae bacterium]